MCFFGPTLGMGQDQGYVPPSWRLQDLKMMRQVGRMVVMRRGGRPCVHRYHVCTVYMSLSLSFSIYLSIYLSIYIYTRNAWVLPRRCSVYISTIHKQMILQITVIPMGKITKVFGTIKQTRSKHPKFLWEKQKQHNI